MLDPFYGVSESGVEIAKWLNRMLLVAELAALWQLAKFQIINHVFGNWVWFVGIPLFLSAMGFLNSLIRQLWNIILTIYFGTTDPHEIGKTVAKTEIQAQIDRQRVSEIRHIASREIQKTKNYRTIHYQPKELSSGTRRVSNLGYDMTIDEQ